VHFQPSGGGETVAHYVRDDRVETAVYTAALDHKATFRQSVAHSGSVEPGDPVYVGQYFRPTPMPARHRDGDENFPQLLGKPVHSLGDNVVHGPG
jgi:hypothetical protein